MLASHSATVEAAGTAANGVEASALLPLRLTSWLAVPEEKVGASVKVCAAEKVWARPKVASVSVAVIFGRFKVWDVVLVPARVRVLPVVLPLAFKAMILVLSVLSSTF